MGHFGDLVVSIAMALAMFAWIYVVSTWIAEGEISLMTGLATIFVSLLLMSVGISTANEVVMYAVLLVLVAAPFSLPLYNLIAGSASDRELNLDRFERAHEAFANNPANIGSRFEIAKQLATLGQYGHAIAIAKGAESMLTDDQGSHQRGTRGMFTKELYDLRHWQQIAQPEDFKNVHCPRCKRPNPPGTIACLSCNSPFLLDIVRAGTKTAHVGGKIVVAWMCFAAVIAGCAMIGTMKGGWTMLFPIALLVAAAGGIINWIMSDRIKFA